MRIQKPHSYKISKLAKFSIILSIIPAIYTALFPNKIAVITMLCSYPLIPILFFLLRKEMNKNFDGFFFVKLFYLYNIIVLVRGLFDAHSSTDWNVMFSSTIPLFLFIHFSIYLVSYRASMSKVFSVYLSYGLFLALIVLIIPVEYNFGFPQVISPICVMAFLIPFLNRKYFLFITSIALVSFFSDISNRSNMLNIIVSFLIVSTSLFKNKQFILLIIKKMRALFLILPILFLVLGVMGIFNIFQVGNLYSDIKISDDSGKNQEVFVDSRTSIYIDVFSQLIKDDAVLFGLGSSGKTETSLIDVTSADFSEIYKEGRRSTESGMLNYIQWGGIVGGMVYFLLFVKASYYGIFKSRNWFCIMLGLWVAYKGLFSFIEDRISFSISSLFIFISLGICLNKNIRLMSDEKIKLISIQILNKSVILNFLTPRRNLVNKYQ